MTFIVGDNGKLGFANTDGDVMAIEVCEVLHPDLLALYEQIDIETDGITSFKLMRGTNGDKMVILTAAAEEAPELELNLPASINLLLPDNEPMNLAGNTHLIYDIAGKQLRVTAGSYFRQNSAAVSNLVAEVLDALRNAKSVLDLYAGVGLFSAFIAEKADYVTVVESYPPAATDADDNTAAFAHVDVIEGTVEDVLEAAEKVYDAAVIDPPSKGMSKEAMDALVALEIPLLVYVSSDVATFARDGQRLRTHGYTLDYVQPLDFAPQTYYTEIVGRFTRSKKQATKSD
jgi:23S rRNA (uracil1939-C5)-methyltransferase